MKPPCFFSRMGAMVTTRGGNLPHWSQTCATFVTFRLADSLPAEKLAQLQEERDEWLKAHPCRGRGVLSASGSGRVDPSVRGGDTASTGDRGRGVLSASGSGRVDPSVRGGDTASTGERGRGVLSASGWTEEEEREYRELFSERLQRWLDAGYGACILRDERIRRIVEASLRHFADERYSLYAYVVMPNHVHVLFMPEEDRDGREIVASWKRFTALAINDVRGIRGTVWQKESYDHLVRDVAEFNAYRSYIRANAPELAFDAYEV